MINKILILVIVVFLINHLTDGKIMETIKSYFNVCKEKMEGFIGLTYSNKKGIYSNYPVIPYELQKDFPHNNKNDSDYLDEESYKLYGFMKNLININTNYSELTPSRDKRNPADKSLVNDIMNQLSKVLNCHGYRFNNIVLLDKIYYHENHRGKEIELFSISADVSYRGKSIGSVIMNFETFLRRDRFCPKEFRNGLLTITNVKLLDRKHPGGITKEKVIKSPYIVSDNNEPGGCVESPSRYQRKIRKPIKQTTAQKKAIQKTQEMATKMTESFNNHFIGREDYDDLFIKPTNSYVTEGFMNDTDNSLIPSIVELSSYEQSSITESSTN
jgi:hypothetical protein